MAEDFTKDPWVKAPDVADAFDRARQPQKRKLENPDPQLAPAQPVPSPMGPGQQATGHVSPQLRRDDKVRELKKAMLMAREFRRAARDPFER